MAMIFFTPFRMTKTKLIMNKTKIFIIAVSLFIGLLTRYSYADAFLVSIAITEGEKSKDSWSSNTEININGSTLSYSKSFSGSRKKKNDNIDKTCTLTGEQIAAIQTLIKNGNLLISDTIEESESKYKSYERFVNIAGDFIMEERISKIRINGSVSSMNDKSLYINIYEVINLIEGYADKCG